MGRSLTLRLAGFCGRLSPRFRSESEATPLKKIPKGLSEPYQSPLTTYEFASEKENEHWKGGNVFMESHRLSHVAREGFLLHDASCLLRNARYT